MPSTQVPAPRYLLKKKNQDIDLYFENATGEKSQMPLAASFSNPSFAQATFVIRPAKAFSPMPVKAGAGCVYQIDAPSANDPQSFSDPKSTAEVIHLSNQYQQLLFDSSHSAGFPGGGVVGLLAEAREGEY